MWKPPVTVVVTVLAKGSQAYRVALQLVLSKGKKEVREHQASEHKVRGGDKVGGGKVRERKDTTPRGRPRGRVD